MGPFGRASEGTGPQGCLGVPYVRINVEGQDAYFVVREDILRDSMWRGAYDVTATMQWLADNLRMMPPISRA
jgi:hypothetical protein